MKKRGISAIIASVLLILLVISLFSVVAYFMRKSPEKIMQEGSESFEKMINCDEINFQVEDVCYDKIFSYTEGKGIRIGLKIKNNNNFKLENFRIKLSSGENGIIRPNELYIEPYGIDMVYAGTYEWKTDIESAKLYPIINGETCDSKEYKINLVGAKPLSGC